MHRKQISIYRMILVFLFTIIIFSTGLYIGAKNTDTKLGAVDDLSQELRMSTLGIEVEYDLLKENLCEHVDSLFLSEELYGVSQKLGFMENALGVDDERVLRLKSYYFILELKHWLLAKRQVEECQSDLSYNTSTILYFYSNEGDCPECEQQGMVLSYLRQKYTGMKVYSFDININSPPLPVLKSIYDITSAPSIVINDDANTGYMSSDDIEEHISNQIENYISIYG